MSVNVDSGVMVSSSGLTQLWDQQASTAGSIAIGTYQIATLGTAGEQDWFALELQVGVSYLFSLSGISGESPALGDPVLGLYAADGSLLEENDDFNGSNSQITYQAVTSGIHYLEAGGYGGGAGSYVLTAGLASDPVVIDDFGAAIDSAGAIQPGQFIVGAIELGGDRDWFAVDVKAGHSYVFSLDSFVDDGAQLALLDPFLGILDATGTLIASVDEGGELPGNARLEWKAVADGRLYLEAQAYSIANTATGRYALGVVDLGFEVGLQLTGTDEADILNGDTGRDTIHGLGGEDLLQGLAGDDWLQGGAGDDVLIGGEGNDTLDGGANGSLGDQVSYALSAAGVSVDLTLGQGGRSGEADVLIDIEHLIGSAHDDWLKGDQHDNRFQPGAGNDIVDGGAGRDAVSYQDATAAVVIDLANGQASGASIGVDDLLSIEQVVASGFADRVVLGAQGAFVSGRAGADTLVGGGGDDTLAGGSGADSIVGGAGFDLLSFQDDGADGAGGDGQGVSVDLASGTAIDNWGDTDRFSAIEAVLGSGLADGLKGDAGDNTLTGGGGDDALDGGAGTDVARYSGLIADHVIATDDAGITTVTDLRADDGDEGSDTLQAIEILRFADGDYLLMANTAPAFITLNTPPATRRHTENGAATLLDPDVRIADTELLAQGHYAGASLSLSRRDGAQPEDVFVATGELGALSTGQDLVLAGTMIGKVAQNAAGRLLLDFGTEATPERVDQVLRAIAYVIENDAPPATVDIEWRFSDGNTGSQGRGGALEASAITTIDLVAVNDAPTGKVWIEGTVRAGMTLTVSHDLADADELGPIRYLWSADGVEIDTAGADTLALSAEQVGRRITVEARYTDGGGTLEQVASAATGPVGNLPGNEGTALTGQVYHWKNHALLADVELQLSAPSSTQPGVRTSNDGGYGFDGLVPGQYGLTASRALTGLETGTVINSADALAALKIAVGRNPNTDPDGTGPQSAPPVSPYQFIAADVNQDGKVNSADALAILKMAVKRSDAPAREWLFVSETENFWNETSDVFTTTRSAVSWDRGEKLLDSPMTDRLNLVAVLKGDVNGSWAVPAGGQALPDSHFQDLQTAGVGPLAQWGVLPV